MEEIIEIVTPPKVIGPVSEWASPISFTGKKKKKKKITAKVMYNNKVYEESVILDDITVKLSDVKVDVSEEENKPKIKIIIMRD